MTKSISAIVIDDDNGVLEVFSEFLELHDFKVLGMGRDGMEAVELYKKLTPDIIFLDVMMQPHDGIFALEKIREINPKAIVIMITADLRQETLEKLQKLKASAVVYKPFEIEEIISMTNKLIESRKDTTQEDYLINVS